MRIIKEQRDNYEMWNGHCHSTPAPRKQVAWLMSYSRHSHLSIARQCSEISRRCSEISTATLVPLTHSMHSPRLHTALVWAAFSNSCYNWHFLKGVPPGIFRDNTLSEKNTECLWEACFFILPSKLRRTFQSQWQILKGLIDILIFSLTNRHYWIQPKSLCPAKPELPSATWHDYLWLKFLAGDTFSSFYSFYSSSPFLFFNSPYATTPSTPFPSFRFSVRDFSCSCTRST